MTERDEMVIDCPYCGEPLDVLVDTYSGAQEYYEDCSVCCQPILFVLAEDGQGEMYLDVKRDDE